MPGAVLASCKSADFLIMVPRLPVIERLWSCPPCAAGNSEGSRNRDTGFTYPFAAKRNAAVPTFSVGKIGTRDSPITSLRSATQQSRLFQSGKSGHGIHLSLRREAQRSTPDFFSRENRDTGFTYHFAAKRNAAVPTISVGKIGTRDSPIPSLRSATQQSRLFHSETHRVGFDGAQPPPALPPFYRSS